MNSHKNAKLAARGREEMIRRPRTKSVAAVVADYGLSICTVRKGKLRYAMGGVEALADASPRPKHGNELRICPCGRIGTISSVLIRLLAKKNASFPVTGCGNNVLTRYS